jgi:predicted MPP superfamily phosphohydrolase
LLVLNVSDLHAPYQHKDAWDFLRDINKQCKPDIAVLGGDEMELAGMSFHEHNPNMPGSSDEFELGKSELKKGLYKIFPKMHCLTSNHTSRGFRRAFKFGIPSQFLRDYKDLLEAPKEYQWRDHWEFDGVLYLHGETFSGKNGAIKAAMEHRQSVVLNHIHLWGGVQYVRSKQGQIFGANSGCLIDCDAMAFRYAKHYATKPTLGVTLVEDGKEAHFITMEGWK